MNTKEGAVKARNSNLKREPDFYKRIGSMGGKKSRGGGFAYSKKTGANWHIEAGRKGGMNKARNRYE